MAVRESLAEKADPNIKVLPIDRKDVFDFWPIVFEHMKDAEGLTHGRVSADDMMMDALVGDSLIWIIFDPEAVDDIYGVAITRILKYPNSLTVLMEFCGGRDADVWFANAEATLVEYAKSVGADMVEALGRRGWIRKLGADWSSERVILTKRI